MTSVREPLQAGLAGADQMMARGPAVVRPLAHGKARLGGDQHAALALAPQRLADDLLRGAGRIDIGRVDQIDPGIDAEIDLPARLLHADIAHLGEVPLAAHGHGAEGDGGDLQAGAAEQAIFHVGIRGCGG